MKRRVWVSTVRSVSLKKVSERRAFMNKGFLFALLAPSVWFAVLRQRQQTKHGYLDDAQRVCTLFFNHFLSEWVNWGEVPLFIVSSASAHSFKQDSSCGSIPDINDEAIENLWNGKLRCIRNHFSTTILPANWTISSGTERENLFLENENLLRAVEQLGTRMRSSKFVRL